jgi:hypothetical protein
MKTLLFRKTRLLVIGLAGLALLAGNALAQDSTTPSTSTVASTASTAQPAAVSAPAPPLSYGVPEVLQMSRANVGDSVIINYIQNSGNNYGLNATQIIYLRQQGVSDAVLNTMLNQRTQSAQIAAATAPPPDNATANSTQPTTAAPAQPAVAYVPATTASTVYVVPDTQTYNYNAWLNSRPYYPYYPYYGYYPAYYPYYYGGPTIALSFGFGFGSYYGGGYHNHGGYYGGWHGGNNNWHGGNSGWHGGNGGWHH